MKAARIDLSCPQYTPNRLLDKTAEFLDVENDSKLALALECSPATISRIRKRIDPISAWLMVRIMDRTGWHIQDLRRMAGMPFDEGERLVVLHQRAPRYITGHRRENMRVWSRICAILPALSLSN